MEKSRIIRIILGISLIIVFGYTGLSAVATISNFISGLGNLDDLIGLGIPMLIISMGSLGIAILLFKSDFQLKKIIKFIRFFLGVIFLCFSLVFLSWPYYSLYYIMTFKELVPMISVLSIFLPLIIITLLFRGKNSWVVIFLLILVLLTIYLGYVLFPFSSFWKSNYPDYIPIFLLPVLSLVWGLLPKNLYKKFFIREISNFLKIIILLYWISGLIGFKNLMSVTQEEFAFGFAFFVTLELPSLLLSVLAFFLLLSKSRKALKEIKEEEKLVK